MKRGGSNIAGRAAVDPVAIWGLHPIEECLKVSASSCLEILYLPSFGRKRRQAALMNVMRKSGVPVRQARDFNGLGLPEGAVHQGVAARVKPFWYADVAVLIQAAMEAGQLLVVCDQISDPRNLGAVIRASAALGASGIVLSNRHGAGITGTVIKASSGAVFHLRTALVSNIPQGLKMMKEKGFWIYGLDSRAEVEIYRADLSFGPLVLVAGSEEKGLRKNVRNELDFQVKIPINDKIESLNVSCAVSIALYECLRQGQA